MSRSAKIFLGILTLLPFVFFAMYLSVFFSFFREMMYHRSSSEDIFFRFAPAFVYIGLVVVSKIGLMIYYLIHAVNNKKLDSTERIVWILIFIFVGLIGYPIYWYMRIWKEDSGLRPTVQ